MKTITLTLKESDKKAWIAIVSRINFTDVARRYMLDPVVILTIWAPLQKFAQKLGTAQSKFTLDVSTAASIFMVMNSMEIESYVSILPQVQKIENYLVNIYSNLEVC